MIHPITVPNDEVASPRAMTWATYNSRLGIPEGIMKVDPIQRSVGTGKEKAQHLRNLATSQRGIRKVLRNAVLQGTISARMPAPLMPKTLMMESFRNENMTHNSRKYPALSAQVINKDRKVLRFCGVL